ncbi:MAG TPA: sigma-70 factor domain-containing protein, partial [Albitalea sp.]|nr:sigma-70 factor domain-containing protein [Albitalea sp.]
MTKRRIPPNGHGHEQLGGSVEPHAKRDPAAMMDIVLPHGIDGEPADVLSGPATDAAIPSELAAGEGEIGNTLQTYLREIRRAPLLTPQQEFDTATRARLGDF